MREALILVDLQVGAFDGIRDSPLTDGEALLARVRGLLTAARSAEIPIVFVQDCGRVGGAYEEGTPHWPIHPTIAPSEGEHVVRKHHSDAFEDTELSSLLVSLEVGRVVVCGQRSEGCLMQTCLGAFAAGFEVVLVSDAHSTPSESASLIIEGANQTLQLRGALLQHTEEILERWPSAAPDQRC